MIDAASDEFLSKVFPDVATRWRRVAQAMWDQHQVQMKVTEGLRTFARQWELYGKGRVKEKLTGKWNVVNPKLIVTKAVPGQSLHQYGLALDSCFCGSDPYLDKIPIIDSIKLWNEFGRFATAYGLQWGGNFKGDLIDRPHCQMLYGMSVQELQHIYEFGGMKGVWEKCKQIVQCGGKAP